MPIIIMKGSSRDIYNFTQSSRRNSEKESEDGLRPHHFASLAVIQDECNLCS
jgi:hypothetical protein